MRNRVLTFAVGLILANAAALGAQEKKRQGPVVHDKESSKLIKLLELSALRVDAVNRLLRRGKSAALDLGQAMADPRPEIVITVAHILRALGPDANAAAPLLEKHAKSSDQRLAYAARWTLAGIRPRGILLISGTGTNELKELNSDGKETFAIGNLPNCFDAERLPDGNYLVTLYSKGIVKEITRKGDVVWEYDKIKNPMDVDRLPTGNTLIASINGQVIEVDPKGKIVWSRRTKSSYEADRLPNGNTLISEFGGNKITEVTPGGKVVWTYKCSNPMDVDRLPNGNTLIVLYGKGIREVTSKGKIVLEFKVPSAYGIDRLPGGDMIVTNNNGVGRYDAKGKVVWKKKIGVVGSVEVY